MEIWDLYDKNRQLTNKLIKRGNDIPRGLYHLVVHVCIFNSKNQMLIQKRSHLKKGFPNYFDVSVGGSVLTKETSCKAARRELKEELGIDIDFTDILPHLNVTFYNCFDDFYLIQKDVDLNEVVLQAEEVSEVRYASLDEILKMIENNEFIPYHPNLIRTLFDMKNLYGAHSKFYK